MAQDRAGAVAPAAAAALEDWLRHAERLHSRPIDLSLDRVREVAGRLEVRLPCPVFIVGGTNGKGSTCALLDAILRSAGYRTGLYTSPHLVRFNERARVSGLELSDAALVEAMAAVDRARDAVSLTYFEFTTLAVLHAFSQAQLDAAVLEIGLGGRLDAVNLVDADCSILTAIDLDHAELLGPTREAIGAEKVRIGRLGRPLVCSDPAPPETVPTIAAEIGADLWLAGRDFSYESQPQQWAYRGRRARRGGLPAPALRGAHQLANASGVLAALEALSDRLPVSQQAVREGLLEVRLPGRFQVLPGRPAVVLDVAHNPHAAAALGRNLDAQGYFPATHAVFGMLRDKDIAGTVARLGSRIDTWWVGPTEGPRGASADVLAAAIREGAGRAARPGPAPDIRICASIENAHAQALSAAGPDDRIVVFGSFLTVGEVMRGRGG